ncbi:MAG: S8 family serine peptidase [Gammaproteobacteria bacterium]
MKSSIPAFLGSMILGAALTLPLSTISQATSVSRLAVTGATSAGRVSPALLNLKGPVDVVVQLSGAPLAVANGENARRQGGKLSHAQQVAHSQTIRRNQDDLLAKVIALGGTEIGRVRIAYNAAIVRIDASKLTKVAALPGVSAVKRVTDYRMDLSDTVPYIGASAAQALGYDGTGVRVAVLDSGVDYTHKNLGGPGTVAAYDAAYADPTKRGGLFPTDKVIEGFDFVGETWPNGPLTNDDDPIDFEGHGTHVSDIIAGKSLDGSHVGVAPGASLIAVRVCSAVATSCSGVAILEGIDYALDPNGDGSMDDAVDVVNMSLGAPYGQREDSSSAAAENAAKAGIVMVISAGNSGNKPYDLGSPSEAPSVISVAQTEVPSSEAIPLRVNAPPAIAGVYGNTATLDWAPVNSTATGDVVFVGLACTTTIPGSTLAANPAGKIALVDRGACNISEKVRAASDAGALGVLVGLVAPGDAVSFSNGGQCTGSATCRPSLVIQQSLSNSIKANIAAPVNVTISPDNAIPLIGSMASTSSRGPSFDFNQIKPDIGAPGASISAIAGSGDGEEAFGGTSGAAPMVSGSAAILVQAYPNRAPWQIKSVLMNTADTQIYTNPALLPGSLAPITRIGGGEVRVDQALASTTAAFDTELRAGSLSFGFHNVSLPTTLVRKVKVENYSSSGRTYAVSSAFRYADDEASGAVKLFVPKSVFVPPRGSKTFDVIMTINPNKLPTWTVNGGASGGNGALFGSVEYDGYIKLKDSRDDIHLAWQVLPHKSADVHAVPSSVTIPKRGAGVLPLLNLSSAQAGAIDVFALTGTSPRIPASQLPADGDEFAVTDIASVGARLVEGQYIQFGINTFGRRAHPAYPVEFDVYIDTNLDGVDDYVLYTNENGGFDVSGQTVVTALNLNTGASTTAFYADADFDSGNMIMTASLASIGLTPDKKFSFDVVAFDNYFTGSATDFIEGMVFTPGKPKYVTSDPPEDGVPPFSLRFLSVDDVAGGAEASPSQSGLLLLYRDARQEAQTISVKVKN